MWAITRDIMPLVAMFISYDVGVILWLPAILQKNHLAIVGTIWSLMSLIATVAIGVIIFKEKLSIYGWLGIILALIATAILASE